VLLRGGVVSLTPNPQPRGPGYPISSGPSPSTCPARVALPVANATAGIALRIIWPRRPSHKAVDFDKLEIPWRGNKTQLDALISQIYFWNKTLHVSDSSSVHHQEFFTVHTAMVYVIQLASRIRTDHPDPADRKLSANLYDIYHYCVYSEKLLMMDRGTVPNI